MSNSLLQTVVLFRLIERAILTVSMLCASAWLIREYIGKSTKIAFSAEKLSLANVSTTVGTPILIALLFVGYTYVDLSNGIEIGQRMPNSSAEITSKGLPGTAQASCQLLSSSSHFKGLNDAAEVEQAAEQSESKDCQKEVAADQSALALAMWIQSSLRSTFTTLANKDRAPNTPDGSLGILDTTLKAGCLDVEVSGLSSEGDSGNSNEDFEQAKSKIENAMKDHMFLSPLCKTLKSGP